MTEEWKAFNKLPGNTVYVLDDSDKPQPWKIQSTYPTGATLYKGQGLAKQWVSRHYRQIISEAPKSEAQKNSRTCAICGERFNPDTPRQRTCPKCRESKAEMQKEKNRARMRERYRERREQGKPKTPAKRYQKICVVCGKEFMGYINRKTCSRACGAELTALHQRGLLGKFE